MNITVRPEVPSDIADIETLTAAAFLNTSYTSHTEHWIVNALRESGNLTLSLGAEVDGKIVGHVAVSPVSISDGSQGWYGLGCGDRIAQKDRQFGECSYECSYD